MSDVLPRRVMMPVDTIHRNQQFHDALIILFDIGFGSFEEISLFESLSRAMTFPSCYNEKWYVLRG